MICCYNSVRRCVAVVSFRKEQQAREDREGIWHEKEEKIIKHGVSFRSSPLPTLYFFFFSASVWNIDNRLMRKSPQDKMNCNEISNHDLAISGAMLDLPTELSRHLESWLIVSKRSDHIFYSSLHYWRYFACTAKENRLLCERL